MSKLELGSCWVYPGQGAGHIRGVKDGVVEFYVPSTEVHISLKESVARDLFRPIASPDRLEQVKTLIQTRTAIKEPVKRAVIIPPNVLQGSPEDMAGWLCEIHKGPEKKRRLSRSNNELAYELATLLIGEIAMGLGVGLSEVEHWMNTMIPYSNNHKYDPHKGKTVRLVANNGGFSESDDMV